MAHKPYEQLERELREAAQLVSVGSHYAHYKDIQTRYTVIKLSVLEATDEVAVEYQSLDHPKVTFVRPLTSWLETVEYNGQTMHRFTKLT